MEAAEMNPVALSLFSSRLSAVCDEMGAVLQEAALSPNIRDRLDFSCAVFDAQGALCAQAAHIPVHLGSMAFAMADVVAAHDWADGDMLILNDPFLGGTHLPDVTLIAPVFAPEVLPGGAPARPLAFVVNRAHHADIGAASPGSMPISTRLDQEGLIIAPALLLRAGELDRPRLTEIVSATRNPGTSGGDFLAQISANRAGVTRLRELIDRLGPGEFVRSLEAMNHYGERLARASLQPIPDGIYSFTDLMDDDGQGQRDIPIRVTLRLTGTDVEIDFAGTADQVPGNINCPLAVAAAAVFYVFRCLMPPQTPACAGSFRPLRIRAPAGSLVNARRPAAVAAGNVETSMRIVDAVLGALGQALPGRIPAASQGSMNNLAMGCAGSGSETGRAWDYYETMAGGIGAGPTHPGASARHSHMTNTLNTPIEVLESRFPLRVRRYALRRGSGGRGRQPGGEGLIREFEFLAPARATLIGERQRHAPWGQAGGRAGQPGRYLLNDQTVPGKVELSVEAGDRLRIETPGGGGFGSEEP